MSITLSGDGSITGLTATGIDAVQNLPAGSVLQVVQGSTTSQTTSSSTSYVLASNLAATITPKFSTSKILVLVSTQCSSGNNNIYLYAGIGRNASVVFEGSVLYTTGAGAALWTPCVLNYLDSPATTSATTYQLYFKNGGGSAGNVQIGWSSPITSTITLMEIAA